MAIRRGARVVLPNERALEHGAHRAGRRVEGHEGRDVAQAHEELLGSRARHARGERGANGVQAVRVQGIPGLQLRAEDEVGVARVEQCAQQGPLPEQAPVRPQVCEPVVEHGLRAERGDRDWSAREGPDGAVGVEPQIVVLASRVPPQQAALGVESQEPDAVVQGEQPAVLEHPDAAPWLLGRVGGRRLPGSPANAWAQRCRTVPSSAISVASAPWPDVYRRGPSPRPGRAVITPAGPSGASSAVA